MVQNKNGIKTLSITVLEESKFTGIDDSKNLKHDYSAKRPDTLFLYYTGFTAILLMLVGGTTLVWSSPAIIKLKSEDPEVNPLGRPIETLEISMLVGIPLLVALVGGSVLPKLADIVGRKMSLCLVGLALLLSLIGIAFSNRIYMFIIFTCIANSMYNGLFGLIPIYITEICEDHNRAKFGCLVAVFLPLGQLYCFLVGPAFSIRDFTLINAAPLIPFLILFIFAPESPVYSYSKGQKEKCKATLEKLRSNKSQKEIESDMQKISDSLTIEENKKKKFKLVALFKTKEGRLGLLFAIIPMLVQFLSGVPTVMLLMAPIFNDIGTISGNTVAIIVGATKVLSYFFTSMVIEKTGRKPMLLLSSIGAGTSVSILGAYFYLNYITSPVLEHIKFLPLLAVMLYIISYAMGLGPIPMAIMSELFPSDVRSVAIGLLTTTAGLVLSIYSFAFPLLADYIGTHWCLWIFGCNCFIGALVIFILLPETKGKSVVEIQKILKEYKFFERIQR